MSLNNHKLTDAAIAQQGVVAAPDKLTGSASQNKALFDRLIRETVKTLHNGLIDELTGTGGASQIGASAITGVAGGSVQAMLGSLKTLLDAKSASADVTAALSLKSDKSVTDMHFKSVSLNAATGAFTFTREDGSAVTVDTVLEKVATNWQYDAATQSLVLTLADETTQSVPLSAFITETEFADSAQLAFSVADHVVTATVKAGSITDTMLSSALLAQLQSCVSAAASSATAAAQSQGAAALSETAAAQSEGAAALSAAGAASDAAAAAAGAATASEKALAAAVSATEALAGRNQALASVQDAAESATAARSWAVGGTGTRAGEDAENAKYWALHAEAAAGGDYIVRPALAEAGQFLAFDGSAWVPVARPIDLTLERIYIDTAPTKTAYYADEAFDPTGMVVKADYYLGASPVVTGALVTGYACPTGALGIGTTSVVISYSEGGTVKTATQALTVTTRVVSVPTLSGNYYYTGSEITPTFAGYDSAILTQSGDVSGTGAGSYTITFALRDAANMMWADASTAPKDVTWSIGKAAPVYTAPTARAGLIYDAAEQALVTAGSVTGGSMRYSLDGVSYAAAVPTAAGAGSYTVYYRVIGDEDHSDLPAESLSAAIAQRTLVISANAQTITYGESIATGVGQVTVNGLADGDALDEITLTPSTVNATASGTITPSAAVVKRGAVTVTGNYAVNCNTGGLTVNKAPSTMTAPTARSLTYTGSAQALVNAGSASGGTMHYSTDGAVFSTAVPSGTNAGGYTVYYKVVGDANHTDTAVGSVSVTIARAACATPTASKSSITLNDDTTSTTFTVTRSGDGAITATSSNTGVVTTSVNGTTVTVNNVNKANGSATITIKVAQGTNYNAYTGSGCTVSVTASFVADGEYGSNKIAGTKTKGSYVRYDGKDWIVANVSGSTYTLYLKKMTDWGAFNTSEENTEYAGSIAATWCATFQNNMSSRALTKVNSKTVRGVTAKVWLPTSTEIYAWTETAEDTNNAWYGIRRWGSNDGIYDTSTSTRAWLVDTFVNSGRTLIYAVAMTGGITGLTSPQGYINSYHVAYRPCIDVVQ